MLSKRPNRRGYTRGPNSFEQREYSKHFNQPFFVFCVLISARHWIGGQHYSVCNSKNQFGNWCCVAWSVVVWAKMERIVMSNNDTAAATTAAPETERLSRTLKITTKTPVTTARATTCLWHQWQMFSISRFNVIELAQKSTNEIKMRTNGNEGAHRIHTASTTLQWLTLQLQAKRKIEYACSNYLNWLLVLIDFLLTCSF